MRLLSNATSCCEEGELVPQTVLPASTPRIPLVTAWGSHVQALDSRPPPECTRMRRPESQAPTQAISCSHRQKQVERCFQAKGGSGSAYTEHIPRNMGGAERADGLWLGVVVV